MSWKVKKSGKIMAYGPSETTPDAETRKNMEKSGYRVYTEKVAAKEKGSKRE